MQNSNDAWAKSIVDRLNVHLRRISKLEAKIKKYDRSPEWRRIFMGGMMYRAYLEVRLMMAEDALIELDLCVREEGETLTRKQNA